MASSTAAGPSASASSNAKSLSKPAKSLLVKLRLSTKVLSKFPSDVPSSKQSRTKSASTSSLAGSDTNTGGGLAGTSEPSPPAAASDSNTTPAPQQQPSANGLLAPPPNPVKRKGVPGPKPGMKRSNSQLASDGAPKPRGKPGPKKKPRLGEAVNGVNGASAPAAPKLGPKANQGAINEKLRALDRSGKPCRKWQRKGFQLKSFTGVCWNVPAWSTWKEVRNSDADGEVKSDSSSSGGGLKGLPDSSAAPSDKTGSAVGIETPLPPVDAESSPAPAAAAAASA